MSSSREYSTATARYSVGLPRLWQWPKGSLERSEMVWVLAIVCRACRGTRVGVVALGIVGLDKVGASAQQQGCQGVRTRVDFDKHLQSMEHDV